MKELKSIHPKEFWKFFSQLEGSDAVFLSSEKTGLVAKKTDNVAEPPDVFHQDKIGRGDFLVFLKMLVALRSGRPVKVVPDPEAKTKYIVYVGPRP